MGRTGQLFIPLHQAAAAPLLWISKRIRNRREGTLSQTGGDLALPQSQQLCAHGSSSILLKSGDNTRIHPSLPRTWGWCAWHFLRECIPVTSTRAQRHVLISHGTVCSIFVVDLAGTTPELRGEGYVGTKPFSHRRRQVGPAA